MILGPSGKSEDAAICPASAPRFEMTFTAFARTTVFYIQCCCPAAAARSFLLLLLLLLHLLLLLLLLLRPLLPLRPLLRLERPLLPNYPSLFLPNSVCNSGYVWHYYILGGLKSSGCLHWGFVGALCWLRGPGCAQWVYSLGLLTQKQFRVTLQCD